MRYFVQQIILACLAFFIVTSIFPGLRIDGIYSYLFSAVLLIIGFAFLKPIINTLTLPIAALTFNLTSFFSTLVIIFLITLFNPLFQIQPFHFSGFGIFGFMIPEFSTNIFLSYVIISATIHIVYKMLYYVFDL